MKGFILRIIPKEPRVYVKVSDKLSDIFIGIGHISLSSIIIPYFFDKGDQNTLFFGIGMAIIFWSMSILVAIQK